MLPSAENTKHRASLYASRSGTTLGHKLGDGKDGTVWALERQSAVKAFLRPDAYARELACYQRLAEHGVEEVRGHAVPRLISYDHDLCIIEIEIVVAPYLLDFADTYLDAAPEFPEDVIEQWHTDKLEQFGPVRWNRVQLVLATLRGQYGIYVLDVNPGNITFGEGEA